MANPQDLIDTTRSLERRIREAGEAIGRAEAQHGRGSEEHQARVEEFRDLCRRAADAAEALRSIAHTIEDLRREYL